MQKHLYDDLFYIGKIKMYFGRNFILFSLLPICGNSKSGPMP